MADGWVDREVAMEELAVGQPRGGNWMFSLTGVIRILPDPLVDRPRLFSWSMFWTQSELRLSEECSAEKLEEEWVRCACPGRKEG